MSLFPPPTLQAANDLLVHDAWLRETPHIDSFCSSTIWGISANYAFGDSGQIIQHSSDHGSALFVWNSLFLRPLECVWLLGSPILGPRPERVFRELEQAGAPGVPPWHAMVLSGLPLSTAEWRPLHEAATRRCILRWVGSRNRNIASLEGGLDGWLSRRSPKFRTNLRRSDRAGEREGIQFTRHLIRHPDDAASFFSIVRDVEHRSHKAESGNGILEEPMHTFVASVFGLSIHRLGLHFVIAWRNGDPIGYVFGTVFMDMYRGLQMSFDDRFRSLSLGNLLQLEMISWLCDLEVPRYDMGADLPYKERWAELNHETVTVALIRV